MEAKPNPGSRQGSRALTAHGGNTTSIRPSEASEMPSGTNPDALMRTDTAAVMPKRGVLKGAASWPKVLKTNLLHPEHDATQEASVLVSDLVRNIRVDASDLQIPPEIDFTLNFCGPSIKECPLNEISKKPGHTPVLKLFHVESHRPRINSEDEGLDDDALFDSSLARKQTERRQSRRRSYIYEAIRILKGDFIFPHRTFRPKVQVAYRVPPGQVPQAVVIERLHRLYKRIDINVVLQSLGVEISDLVPPPNYGEENERFYQESMWRNRVRISGMEKREYILSGGKGLGTDHADHTYVDSSSSEDSEGSSSSDEEEEEGDADKTHHHHPFIKLKPPFGPQFPLDFFDNEDFDIRSGEDWIKLGWDPKDKKMYRIPGKAFLPMPLSSKRPPGPSLSEVTNENLLTKSEALDDFRKWLLKERYKRQLKTFGKNFFGSFVAPSDAQMTIIARTVSAIPSLFGPLAIGEKRLSRRATRKLLGDKSAGFLKSDGFLSETTMSGDYSDSEQQFAEEEGSKDSLEIDLDEGKDSKELMLNILRKGSGITAEIQPAESYTEFELEGGSEMATAKNSLIELHGPREGGESDSGSSVSFEETESQRIEFEGDEFLLLNEPVGGVKSEYEAPGSPDDDPYDEGGYQELVYDFDKMKKVHKYDWKWVEVAIFDYNPVTRKYLVRSIFPPVVYAWVNKLYVVMDGEDPNKHGERLKDAIIRRIAFEEQMRFNLYVDCLPLLNAPRIPGPCLGMVYQRLRSTPKLDIHSEHELSRIEQEVQLEFQRSHMRMLLDHIVDAHSRIYKPWILHPEHASEAWTIPVPDWNKVSERYMECASNYFSYKCSRLLRESAQARQEAFDSISRIVGLCLDAKELPFIVTRQNQLFPLPLEEYEQVQFQQMTTVKEWLNDVWLADILHTIRKNFNGINKSWYNINENRWDVYKISKCSKFLTLIKFMMQDTLRFMVLDSLNAFVEEIEELTTNCQDVTRNYKWKNDFKISDFPPPYGLTPIFAMELALDKDGPIYTHLLGHFPRALLKIFAQVFDAAGGVPDIIPIIMTKLIFGERNNLFPIDKSDLLIQQLKDRFIRALRRGLLPIDIYAQTYQLFMPIWNLDLPAFLDEWESENHSLEEIKLEIETHMAELEEIKQMLPQSIDIGPFRVNVYDVKNEILERKEAIFIGILESFANKLRTKILRIREEYTEIEKRLGNKTEWTTLEVVTEMKEFVDQMPSIIKETKDEFLQIVHAYDLFEDFNYPIPPEDFEIKWAVALQIRKVERISEDCASWLEVEYEKLYKIREAEIAAMMAEQAEMEGEGYYDYDE